MHYLTNLTALNDEGSLHTLAGINQVMMYGAHGEQRWDGGMGLIHATVAQDDVVVAIIHALGSLLAEFIQSLMQSFFALGGFEEHVELDGIESLVADILKDIQLGIGQNRMWQTNHLAVAFVWVQDAGTYPTDILGKTHHEVLTDGVDGRVGNLSKLLTEVVEEICGWSESTASGVSLPMDAVGS